MEGTISSSSESDSQPKVGGGAPGISSESTLGQLEILETSSNGDGDDGDDVDVVSESVWLVWLMATFNQAWHCRQSPHSSVSHTEHKRQGLRLPSTRLSRTLFQSWATKKAGSIAENNSLITDQCLNDTDPLETWGYIGSSRWKPFTPFGLVPSRLALHGSSLSTGQCCSPRSAQALPDTQGTFHHGWVLILANNTP